MLQCSNSCFAQLIALYKFSIIVEQATLTYMSNWLKEEKTLKLQRNRKQPTSGWWILSSFLCAGCWCAGISCRFTFDFSANCTTSAVQHHTYHVFSQYPPFNNSWCDNYMSGFSCNNTHTATMHWLSDASTQDVHLQLTISHMLKCHDRQLQILISNNLHYKIHMKTQYRNWQAMINELN